LADSHSGLERLWQAFHGQHGPASVGERLGAALTHGTEAHAVRNAHTGKPAGGTTATGGEFSDSLFEPRVCREWKQNLPPPAPPDTLEPVKATMPEPEIVTRKGKTCLRHHPIKDYQELLERGEDTDDVAWLKARPPQPLPLPSLEDYLPGRNRT